MKKNRDNFTARKSVFRKKKKPVILIAVFRYTRNVKEKNERFNNINVIESFV